MSKNEDTVRLLLRALIAVRDEDDAFARRTGLPRLPTNLRETVNEAIQAGQASEQQVLAGYIEEKEFAELIGCSTRTVKRWRNEPNGLPFVKLGIRIFLNVDSAKRWIAEKEIQRNPRRPRKNRR